MQARIVATKKWVPGDEIRMCTGGIGYLNPEQDVMLRQTERDFSVMWSTRKSSHCLFLGPARFMNVSKISIHVVIIDMRATNVLLSLSMIAIQIPR